LLVKVPNITLSTKNVEVVRIINEYIPLVIPNTNIPHIITTIFAKTIALDSAIFRYLFIICIIISLPPVV
jgi:hypothetical protein